MLSLARSAARSTRFASSFARAPVSSIHTLPKLDYAYDVRPFSYFEYFGTYSKQFPYLHFSSIPILVTQHLLCAHCEMDTR